MTTLAHYTTILDAAGEDYAVLPLQNGASALITLRGGRVLGLFPASDAPNLFWTSKAFDSVETFKAFTTRTDGWAWNLGGDRCWIAPEITYNVRDRRDFAGTWHIPEAMDPGSYSFDYRNEQVVSFGQLARLTAYQQGEQIGEIQTHLRRAFIAGSNPLVRHDTLRDDVQYIGYQQTVNLEAHTRPANGGVPLFGEVWNLVQLNAGGTLIIPVIGTIQASDYVKPVPDYARHVQNGVLHLPLNGTQQFKIGYKALCMTGRMGYLHTLADGRAYLLVRSFYNDPSNLYAEEPPDEPGNTGHSVHIYNDGGAADNGSPFCEMECGGQTLGTFENYARVESRDTFNLWAYVGAPDAIREIARLLLGSAG